MAGKKAKRDELVSVRITSKAKAGIARMAKDAQMTEPDLVRWVFEQLAADVEAVNPMVGRVRSLRERLDDYSRELQAEGQRSDLFTS